MYGVGTQSNLNDDCREEKHSFARISTTEDRHTEQTKQRCGREYIIFRLQLLLLLIPLTLSIPLLYIDADSWLLPGSLYNMVNNWRTSVQTVSLNMLDFWSALSNSDSPLELSYLDDHLWTGALTPVNTLGTHNTTIRIPDWSNITLIKEYPSQIDSSGPSVRTIKGLFTYSVGMGLLGSLLASANSASTVDGSIRNHNKLDNTRYNYHGRSFGAGSSAGLNDHEVALASSVSCIYNSSSELILEAESGVDLYPAEGYLPDSTGGEYSTYLGYGTNAIVAIGVAARPVSWTAPTRYMAIAVGHAYKYLNKVQCAVTFTPSRINVSVDVSNHNITVHKVAISNGTITNIDPHGNITHVVMHQLELISNDQTSFYRSTVGDAFNASISDYRTSIKNNATTNGKMSDSQIVLKGVENAVVSYIDDMLVAYASAQLQVGEFTKSAPTVVHVEALRVGSRGYIIASACIIIGIIFLVIAEAVRLQGWRALPVFDYLDTRMLVMGASRGGYGIPKYADRERREDLGSVTISWRGEAPDDVRLISVGIPQGDKSPVADGPAYF
ncbi:hypothetical protein N7490_007793 [Penicillium lividum]|nr:hypothetical protein N7490_007793 [Penicillium lividum]